MKPKQKGGWITSRIYDALKALKIVVKRHTGSCTMNFSDKRTWLI